MVHLSFYAAQGEDGDIDCGNDEDTKKGWANHFVSGVEYYVETFVQRELAVSRLLTQSS